MDIKFETHSVWNDAFMERFIAFRNKLYFDLDNEIPEFLPESMSDLHDLYGPQSVFSQKNYWRAWLFYKDDEPVARVIASHGQSGFISYGYFECINDSGVSHALFAQIHSFANKARAKFSELTQIRGPIQGNFFNSYRIKLPGGGPSFLGEPIFPNYYHDLFRQAGFEPGQIWETIEIGKSESLEQFENFGRRMQSLWEKEGINIRSLNMKDWENELKRVHTLLEVSYSDMANFAPIDFTDFKKMYDSFKYFIHPDLVLFAERRGEPVGFLIGMFDPLEIILRYQEKLKMPVLKYFYRLKLMFELKKNRKQLLILYTGKIPNRGAKWSVMAMGQKFMHNAIRLGAESALVCYVGSDSATRISLPKKARTVSKYALYEKNIDQPSAIS